MRRNWWPTDNKSDSTNKNYKITLLLLNVKNKNQLNDIFKNNKAHKRGKGKLRKKFMPINHQNDFNVKFD